MKTSTILILIVLVQPMTAGGQPTAKTKVKCPAMLVLQEAPNYWRCQREVTDVTVTFPDKQTLQLKKVKAVTKSNQVIDIGDVVIPPTGVPGFFRRSVDACIGEGKLNDDSTFTMYLPKERVKFSRFERVPGHGIRAVMVAVQIVATTKLVKLNGETWEGSITFPPCETHWVERGVKLADPLVADGSMVMTKEAIKAPRKLIK